MGGRTDEWKEGWVDGRMSGQTDGWKDEWVDGH